MNNIRFCVLLAWTLVGTNNTSQSPVTLRKTGDSFKPDISINGKLKLEDYRSLGNLINDKNVRLNDKLREHPVATFKNRRGTQYLMAYQYEGDTKNAFGCFEVGYLKDKMERYRFYATKENVFATNSGLKLGLALQKVVQIKGDTYRLNMKKDTIMTYRMTNPKSTLLTKYNMPSYFMSLYIKQNKVTRMVFGFDYP